MSLKYFYDEIRNPLDNPTLLDNIITAYLKTERNHSFYGSLVKLGADKKKYPDRFKIKDRDEFYSLLFNEWKNRIVSMTKAEFLELQRRNILDNSFIKLRNYLKTIPDLTTYDEVNKVLHSQYQDRELDAAMDKYRFTAFGEGSSWNHISSHAVTTEKEHYFPIYHRLYLNTEGIDTYKIITEFTKKCIARKIPYYFKFTEFCNRQDNIVVYANTDHLYDYIEILREIIREQKDVIHPYEPPMMTAPIDGWIGYGSEPERKPNGELQSFNEKRADLLELAIKESTFKFMDKNKNAVMRKNGKEKLIGDYFIDKCVFFFVDDLKQRLERYTKYHSPQEAVNTLGYSLDDLRNPVVIDNIRNVLKDRKDELRNNKKVNIELTVRNNKKVVFTTYHLESAIRRLITVAMPTKGHEFKQILRAQIEEMMPQNNISRSNFALDSSTVRRINKFVADQERLEEERRRGRPKKSLEDTQEFKIRRKTDLSDMFVEIPPEPINNKKNKQQ